MSGRDEPGQHKFLVIGAAIGLLAGAVIGVVFWIFWNSRRAFVFFLLVGVLSGLWLGRKLRLVPPDHLGSD